jgi:hypothetical protein
MAKLLQLVRLRRMVKLVRMAKMAKMDRLVNSDRSARLNQLPRLGLPERIVPYTGRESPAAPFIQVYLLTLQQPICAD